MDLREDEQKLLDENPQPLDDADILKAAAWLLTAAAAVKKHAAVAMERRISRESRSSTGILWPKVGQPPTNCNRSKFNGCDILNIS